VSAPHQPSGDTTTVDAATLPEAALPDADQAGEDAVLDPAEPTSLESGADEDGGATEADEADEDDEDGDEEDGEDDDGDGDDLLVREGDVAGDYLERLLDILDVDGDIDLDVEGDRASVAIVGGQLTDLVGRDGAVLDALQELTRLAVAQSTGVRSRLMLDIGGFRAKRRADLSALAGEAARRVAQSRQPERLSPMNPFERKVVHDVIAAVSGVRSESEGEEPNRRVVILPDA
jgi:spoIIIJ-associated protein